MNSLKRPPFRFPFSSGPVRRLSADLPLEIVDGSPVLPGLLLWALSLNPGDLLIASASRGVGNTEWVFASYREIVSGCAQACSHPWPFVAEALRHGALAAVGRKGDLRLPDEAAALVRPGHPIRLQAEAGSWRRQVVLSVREEGPIRPAYLFVEAEYRLPVEPGLRVTLPEEALWALGFESGERLVAEAHLADIRFAASAAALPGGSGKRLTAALEPGGSLALPDSLRVESVLRPQAQVRLIVTLSPQPAFRITQWVE
jgi:hypothetical protein